MTDKPSHNEDEFFAREDAEKLYKLHKENQKQQTAAQLEAEKQAHWMKCPKCGYGLETVKWRKVEIDKCFRCGVIALDDGELEQLAGNEQPDSFIATFSRMFKAP